MIYYMYYDKNNRYSNEVLVETNKTAVSGMMGWFSFHIEKNRFKAGDDDEDVYQIREDPKNVGTQERSQKNSGTPEDTV